MGKYQMQVANQFKRLAEASVELMAKYEQTDLPDVDRMVTCIQLESINSLFKYVQVILDHATDKKKAILAICLSGDGCNSNVAYELNYNSVDSMNKARNRLIGVLSITIFNEEKIDDLLKSTSYDEVFKAQQWFFDNVLKNKQLAYSLVQ
ncbi:hypothetical protein J41TS12_36820 [Paenibacillus antibioticophila]|uniref:Uncharacterized protein n=1 Tax=Paenibacillus antibioticophila TaxID=1274374 RepID=A0A919XUT5_9BACL|nr:hypothetical protein [Paenibacillus antibioticophila]GIO38821.1 hypothetical protein J41TS12_36820 [Paenibacillus antibioticophila]